MSVAARSTPHSRLRDHRRRYLRNARYWYLRWGSGRQGEAASIALIRIWKLRRGIVRRGPLAQRSDLDCSDVVQGLARQCPERIVLPTIISGLDDDRARERRRGSCGLLATGRQAEDGILFGRGPGTRQIGSKVVLTKPSITRDYIVRKPSVRDVIPHARKAWILDDAYRPNSSPRPIICADDNQVDPLWPPRC